MCEYFFYNLSFIRIYGQVTFLDMVAEQPSDVYLPAFFIGFTDMPFAVIDLRTCFQLGQRKQEGLA